MDIDRRLRTLMKLRGFNGKQLARLTGISRSSICLYLKGERVPKQDQIVKLAKALNSNPAYLLGLTNEIFIPSIQPLNTLLEETQEEIVMKRALISEITELVSCQDIETLKTILSIIRTLTK